MGLLRFFLAFLVVYGHCGSPFGGTGLGAQNAVQAFYLISGFYMTLVLREKYGTEGRAGIQSFYLNRWLRLYPAYLAVLAGTLLFCLVSDLSGAASPPPEAYLAAWLENGLLDWKKVGALVASQFSMVGLDVFNLVTLTDQGAIVATAGASVDKYPLWRLLLVPQAWSLSIELYFYLLAPFLVTRGLRTVLWVGAASFLVRLVMWRAGGFYLDPWSYRFFPSELLFFLAGAIGYHVYARSTEFQALRLAGKLALYAGTGTLLAFSVWLGHLGQPQGLKSLLPPAFTVAVFVAIPALFRHTRQSGWDRLIGELSYPIYISHILVIWIVGGGNYRVGKAGFLLVSLLTIALSYTLYRWIDLPMDRFRHRTLSPSLVAEHAHPGRAGALPAARI